MCIHVPTYCPELALCVCLQVCVYLGPGVSCHQALQLQGPALSDGEHPLAVALLLHVAALA